MPATLGNVLTTQSITTPTAIQAATLPDSLAGRDVLGRGRTGSGKTLAFLLPLVTRLSAPGRTTAQRGAPRALILAPTRELVSQIHAALLPLAATANLSTMTIFGGVSQGPQVQKLSRGVDIVVATPGRLEDLIGQRHARLTAVEITVLDEADHMADLGFLPSVKRILGQTPSSGQRMLFSATLDKAVDGLVKTYLSRPVVHEADSAASPVATMRHHVLHIERGHRLGVLVDLASAPGRTVVFTRTKRGAKLLARQLNSEGVPTVDLHGNLSQGARTRNLEAFGSGRAMTMVATDIAARGIHVDDVALVIHADPPTEHKAYLHRSGRTARAGAEGTVVTLMSDDQQREVKALTRAAGVTPVTTRLHGQPSHPVLSELAPGPRVRTGGLVLQDESASPRGGRPAGGSGRRRTGSGARTQSASAGAGAGRNASAGAGRSASTTGRRQGATTSRPASSAADFSAGHGGRAGSRRRGRP